MTTVRPPAPYFGGKPDHCTRCGASGPGHGRYEWANLTGRYDDVADYARMCGSCHHRFDAERRRQTGRPTSPKAKGGGVSCPTT